MFFRELQPDIEFGWAVRVIAFLALFFGIVANVLLRSKVPAVQMREFWELEFFRSTSLVLFWIALFWGSSVHDVYEGDLRRHGTFSGTGFLIASPGVLVGSPISGAILRSNGGFDGLQAFAGCILLITGVFLIAARVMAVGWGVQRM